MVSVDTSAISDADADEGCRWTRKTRCDRQPNRTAGVGRVVVDGGDCMSSDADDADEVVVGHAKHGVIASPTGPQV